MKPKLILIQVISVSIVVLSLISSCQPGDRSAVGSKKTTLTIPVFSADSAYANIEKQLSFGFRVPGTKEHSACAQWLVQTLESYGLRVHQQDFKANFLGRKNVACKNIMGQINPSLQKRILLAAHWDSRSIAEKDPDQGKRNTPIPGADDGASGVGVLLEIARVLTQHPIDMGVDILFFDAEDQGDNTSTDLNLWGLGSQHWSKNKVPSNYKARYGILLDMVGAEDATFGKEEYSIYYANVILKKIWELAGKMGYSDYFQNFTTGAVVDDHYFVNIHAQIPMLDIINISPKDQRSFVTYHHTHGDNLDKISVRTLHVVGQVLTSALYRESEGKL